MNRCGVEKRVQSLLKTQQLQRRHGPLADLYFFFESEDEELLVPAVAKAKKVRKILSKRRGQWWYGAVEPLQHVGNQRHSISSVSAVGRRKSEEWPAVANKR